MATTKKKTTSPSYLGDYASGNYTPSYDYVSGYYNQNAGYQNPSVYGYRGSRYNIPTNSGFSIPMKDNDPYWNLGAMLGGLWGAQYNKRGAERAGEEANAMLQDEYNRLMGVETPKQPTANDQMYDMAQKAGAIPERQAQLQMPGQEQTPKAEDLSKGLKYTDQQGSIVGPQQPDYKGEKLSYLDKKYGLINGQQHDNPEGDKKVADKTSQAVGTDISNIDVTKLPQGFNSDLLRANIVSKLKAAGRNEWQIAQAMQGIEPQILGKQREYNTQQFNNLYGMYDSLTKAGRIDEAGMVLDKMKQFNPEGAAMLQKQYEKAAGFQAKRDNYKQNVAFLKEIYPEKSDDEIRDMAMGFSGVKGYGKGAGSSKSSKGTSSTGGIFTDDNGDQWITVTDKQANEYQSRMEKIASRNKEKSFEDWSQSDKDDYMWYQSAVRANINRGSVRPFGWKPKKQEGSGVLGALNLDEIANNEEALLGIMAQKIGPNTTAEQAQSIISNLEGLGTPAAQNVASVYRSRYAETEPANTSDTESSFDKLNKPLAHYISRTQNDSLWNKFLDGIELDDKFKKDSKKYGYK